MDCKIVKRILNNKAVQKLLTPKPSTNLSARRMIQALITNRNRPKVSIVAGKVNRTNKGLTKMFNNPRTAATTIAVTYPSTETPFNNLDKITTATAVNKTLNIVFIFKRN